MAAIFTIGRICYKTTGRDAGSRVIVVETGKDGMVHVEGANTKKSKTNVAHLLPTTKKVTVPAGHTHKDIQKLLKDGE